MHPRNLRLAQVVAEQRKAVQDFARFDACVEAKKAADDAWKQRHFESVVGLDELLTSSSYA